MSIRGYFVGIGSNIEPGINIPRIITELLKLFEKISVTRIIQTKPIGIKSYNNFLNLVVFISTKKSRSELKTYFNKIETKLGRDRTDINRKYKDRTADLDILLEIVEKSEFIFEQNIPEEPYVKPILIELINFLGIKPSIRTISLPEGVEIFIKGISLGKAPATIYRKRNTGQIMILHDCPYG